MRRAAQGNALCLHHHGLNMHMISVQTALACIQANSPTPSTETVALQDAMDRILAQDVSVKLSMPPFPAANMDGYAVAACETGDNLEIIGESAAGTPFEGSLRSGQTIRISTGAMMPAGADRILIQEHCHRDENRVMVKTAPKPQTHVRQIGSDFQTGERLFRSNQLLRAADLTLIAAAGHAEIVVNSKLRVAILSTGDELRPIGAKLNTGQIHAANAIGLTALLEHWDADVTDFGIIADDPEAISECLPQLADFDIIIPIGGASVGDHDLMRPAFQAADYEPLFETVAVRPGKPCWMAKKDTHVVFGLPGNPASSFVCAHLFLHSLLGHHVPIISAKLDKPVEENGPRETYLRGQARVKDGEIYITPFGAQDSFRLRPQSEANALIKLPPMGGPYRAGDVLHVILIDALIPA